jgi:hypothetical protein
MIAGEDQTVNKNSSFLDCLTHEKEGIAIIQNVEKHFHNG